VKGEIIACRGRHWLAIQSSARHQWTEIIDECLLLNKS
jgi:hypothetical protein